MNVRAKRRRKVRLQESIRRAGRHRFTWYLREDFAQAGRPLRVNRDLGIIYGVKICGLESINGRKYTLDALRQAAPLYEGVMVNVDHPEDDPDETRSSYDRFGKLQRVRVKQDGLYGDLHFLTSHTMAKRICEDAEKGLGLFGLSHNATGRGESDANGVQLVQEITAVRHVDLVADPATVNSLFESRRSAMATKTKTQATGKGKKGKDLLEGPYGSPGDDLRMDQAKMAGTIVPDEEDDSEAPDYSSDGPDLHGSAADMIEALLRDLEAGEIDHDTLVSKVRSILNAFKDDEGGGDEEEDDEDDEDTDEEEDDEEMQDSVDSKLLKKLAGSKDKDVRKLVETLDAVQVKQRITNQRLQAQQLCQKMKLPRAARTAVFMESLYQAPNRKAMKRLIQDRRSLVETRRPTSHSRDGRGMQELDAKAVCQIAKDE